MVGPGKRFAAGQGNCGTGGKGRVGLPADTAAVGEHVSLRRQDTRANTANFHIRAIDVDFERGRLVVEKAPAIVNGCDTGKEVGEVALGSRKTGALDALAGDKAVGDGIFDMSNGAHAVCGGVKTVPENSCGGGGARGLTG
jgi:hypothetical protein